MKHGWYLKGFFLIFVFLILLTGCEENVKTETEKENTFEEHPTKKEQKISADKVDQSNMDVVFVMDKSGSMTKSDKDRVAVTGAKMFLDMMRESGSHAAVVDFAGKAKSSGLIAIESSKNKDYLKEYLDSIQYDSGVTDYGLALKKAVSLLKKADGNNQKAILFFTDGNLNTGKRRKLSEARNDIEQAVSEAKQEGYKIYCIGLNNNKKVDKVELSKIASDTNGECHIINRASELIGIFESIFTDIGSIITKPIIIENGKGTVHFEIDSEDVIEANIIMLSNSKLSDVRLCNPDGKEVNLNKKNYIFTNSAKYSVLKLVEPRKGKWKLDVKGAKKEQIEIRLVYNYDFSIETNASISEMERGKKVKISSYLVKEGDMIEGKSFYKKLSATVNVRFFEDGEEKNSENLEMKAGKDGFTAEMELKEFGEYRITVHIEEDEWYRDSEVITISVERLPVEQKKKLSDITVKKGETKEIELADYFRDPQEEGLIFTAAVNGKDNDKLQESLNGSVLKVHAKEAGSEIMTLTVSNGYEKDLSLDIKIKGETFFLKYGIKIIIAAAVILLGILFILYSFLKKCMRGEIELKVIYEKKDPDSGGIETESYEIQNDIHLASLGKHGFTADRLLKVFGKFYRESVVDDKNNDYDFMEEQALGKLKQVSFQPEGKKHAFVLKKNGNGEDIVFLGKNSEVISGKMLKIGVDSKGKMEFGIKVTFAGDNHLKLNAVYK